MELPTRSQHFNLTSRYVLAELANLDISDNLAELTALTPAETGRKKGREGTEKPTWTA